MLRMVRNLSFVALCVVWLSAPQSVVASNGLFEDFDSLYDCEWDIDPSGPWPYTASYTAWCETDCNGAAFASDNYPLCEYFCTNPHWVRDDAAGFCVATCGCGPPPPGGGGN